MRAEDLGEWVLATEARRLRGDSLEAGGGSERESGRTSSYERTEEGDVQVLG